MALHNVFFVRVLPLIISSLSYSFALVAQPRSPVALLTGATGRTGQLVTNLLLERGYDVILFCRDEVKARQNFHKEAKEEYKYNKICFVQGDISCPEDVQNAFHLNHQQSNDQLVTTLTTSTISPTHVVFMAGGEGADYRTVNYKGVATFAEIAAECDTVQNFVVISTAWDTKPYSIASLLFNSIYKDTVPMASHYLGEQALRNASTSSKGKKFNYVILRAGGLNSDENYAKKYPEAAGKGLTYDQGDEFEFFGFAGRPGMARSQLANAVVSAMNVDGRYTVEVTGSGATPLDDSSVYQTLTQDSTAFSLVPTSQEESIMRIHTQAVEQLKLTAIAASFGGLVLIGVFGWVQGILLLLSLDAVVLFIWSQFFANRQAC